MSNKLGLFKSGDLFDLIKTALEDYDGETKSTNDQLEGYTIECEDEFDDDKHYVIATVFETSEHFPWQPGDISYNVNNRFKITIECI